MRCFGYAPIATAFAPGRVNVIGAHTDYNGGYVISAALPIGTVVSIGNRGGSLSRFISDAQPSHVQLTPGEIADDLSQSWTRYVVGVLVEMGLRQMAFDVSVCSNLPTKRGLASSAALTVSTALAASTFTGPQSTLELAKLCQRAETYVGVRCGLLDPYTSLHAQPGMLLLVDCASESHQHVPFPSDLVLVICDSGISRELAKSQYDIRRRECQRIAERLGRRWLRDVQLKELDTLKGEFPIEARRAEHVIREIERVREFADAIARHDIEQIRKLMHESHVSARDLFECTLPVLNTLVESAAAVPGCIGSRVTGAGWGGATISIVPESSVVPFQSELVAAISRSRYALRSSILVLKPSSAARIAQR